VVTVRFRRPAAGRQCAQVQLNSLFDMLTGHYSTVNEINSSEIRQQHCYLGSGIVTGSIAVLPYPNCRRHGISSQFHCAVNSAVGYASIPTPSPTSPDANLRTDRPSRSVHITRLQYAAIPSRTVFQNAYVWDSASL
jgi:hypothetical protein